MSEPITLSLVEGNRVRIQIREETEGGESVKTVTAALKGTKQKKAPAKKPAAKAAKPAAKKPAAQQPAGDKG